MPDTRIEAVIRRARYNKATSVMSWRDRSDGLDSIERIIKEERESEGNQM